MGSAMPPEIREQLRSSQHPALSVQCPHCEALPNRRCRLKLSGRLLESPHPSRCDKLARVAAE